MAPSAVDIEVDRPYHDTRFCKSPSNLLKGTMPKFDPALHLNFIPPAKRYSFTELGLDAKSPPVDMCISDPFSLFTEEAVRLIRRELFQPEVFDNYMHSWARAPCVIRGAATSVCQFIRDAWTHPATVEAVSNAAGIDLIPVMDWEIGHTNIQVGSKGLAGVRELNEIPTPALSAEEVARIPVGEFDNRLVDDWHIDSYQFVCVAMLSDASTMRGGETAIETGNGSIVKMRGAQMGGAVVLQGGYTKHAAYRTIGAGERVSMVTSYRPRNIHLRDNSTLRNISSATSDMREVRYQWAKYRLGLVSERVQELCCRLDTRKGALTKDQPIVEQEEFKLWVEEQVDHLQKTTHELFDRVKTTW